MEGNIVVYEGGSLEVEVAQPIVARPVVNRAARRAMKKIDGKRANKAGIRMTISKRDGLPRFEVQIRRAECRFYEGGIKTEAEAKRIYAEALAGIAKARAERVGGVPVNMTMATLFDRYESECARLGNPLPDDQVAQYKRLKAHPLLKDVKVSEMCYTVMKDYCASRKTVDGVHPSTIQNEFARVSVAITSMAMMDNWGENFISPLAGARKRLKLAKLISDSTKRNRRPTREERRLLAEHFAGHVMADVVEFAAINSSRRAEIARMRWADLDVEHSTIICWRKDSASEEVGENKGRRKTYVPILPAAMEIILRQPRTSPFIFNIKAGNISQKWDRAIAVLRAAALAKDAQSPMFDDLHFHDMRHEAITTASRFLTQSQLKALSGHKSDKHVARYINHSQEDLSNISKMCAAIKSAV